MKSKIINNNLQPMYNVACEVSGVDIKENRKDIYTYTYGRAIFYNISKEIIYKIPVYQLGAYVNRDHASVLHALKKIETTYKYCTIFKRMLFEAKVKSNIIKIPQEKEVERLKRENERLSEKLKVYKNKKLFNYICSVPEEMQEDLIENRLIPYFKMNKIEVPL